eukprot:scaffold102541_cov33-Tisochrysis_lutea.AAC.1
MVPSTALTLAKVVKPTMSMNSKVMPVCLRASCATLEGTASVLSMARNCTIGATEKIRKMS